MFVDIIKVYCTVNCHRQRSTKLSTTYANVWTRAFWRVLDILRILCELQCESKKIPPRWPDIFSFFHKR